MTGSRAIFSTTLPPPEAGGSAARRSEIAVSCRCDAEKLGAIESYLREQPPGYTLSHFHAPARLEQAGLPGPHADHHVIGVRNSDEQVHHAVLLAEFQKHSALEVTERVRRWDLGAALRTHRIVVVSKDILAPL